MVMLTIRMQGRGSQHAQVDHRTCASRDEAPPHGGELRYCRQENTSGPTSASSRKSISLEPPATHRSSSLPKWLSHNGFRRGSSPYQNIHLLVCPYLKSSPPLNTSRARAGSAAPDMKVFSKEPLLQAQSSRMEACTCEWREISLTRPP